MPRLTPSTRGGGQDEQTYGMACLNFMHAGRTTRACSTHLAAGKGDDRDAVRLATTQEIAHKGVRGSTTSSSSAVTSTASPGAARWTAVRGRYRG